MNKEPIIGKPAPDFSMPATGGNVTTLDSYAGKTLVLYFYPRDNTPGCTTEAQDFSAAYGKFKRAGAVVLGVSQDSVRKHDNFKAKVAMPFNLATDESGDVCRAYGVLKMKQMYGKSFEGIERSTFIIDANGVLRDDYRKVKVPGHVDEVLAAVKKLKPG